MTALRRILALLLVLLGIIGTAACIAGIVGVWRVKQPLLDRSARAFGVADKAFVVVTEYGDVISFTLTKSREDLGTIKTKAAIENNAAAKPSFTDVVVSRMVADQLGTKIKNVGDAVNAVTDASIVLDSLLGQIDQLPATFVHKVNDDQLEQVQGTLGDVAAATRRLSSLLQTARPDENVPPEMAEATVEIEALLGRLLAWIDMLRERVKTTKTEVAELRPRLEFWIHWGSAIITGVLAWIGFSQLVVVGVAWRWLRRGGA